MSFEQEFTDVGFQVTYSTARGRKNQAAAKRGSSEAACLGT
jgi:hypothetical protein